MYILQKKLHISLRLATLLLFCLTLSSGLAQYEIKPAEGYSPQIGVMVDMLEELKDRITEDVKDLNQVETDFMFDDKANSIGAMIMHLAANEAYYQTETLEGRPWTDEEAAFWSIGGELNDESKAKLKDKPISYYLGLWDDVRKKTLEGLKNKDDAWFAAAIDEGINNHWVWFHVLEHMASHMGQISLVKSRLPK